MFLHHLYVRLCVFLNSAKLVLQVVDARAGPGTKSLTKFKAKNKKKKLKAEGSKKLESVKKKHVYVKNVDRDRSPTTFSDGGLSSFIS